MEIEVSTVEQKPEKKMFLQIVKQLPVLIAEQNIQKKQKLPSERVLTEQLQVGRSSVREALRSLELLGLIETKHGGGTYLASMKQHQFVEVLSSFILQDEKSAADVLATRKMHEKEAIRIICQSTQLRTLPIWDSFFIKVELGEAVSREDLLRECIIISGNRLALKIWMQLASFSGHVLTEAITKEEKLEVEMMLKAMQMGYTYEAIQAYEKWMGLIER